MDEDTRARVTDIVKRGQAETVNATVDAAQALIAKRIEGTYYATDARLLKIASKDLDSLRVALDE
jgi:hypothetical protein